MQFDSALVTAREILAEYGAHGDLALAYQLRPFDHQVYFDATPNVGTRDVQGAPIVRTWTTFDEEAVGERVRRDRPRRWAWSATRSERLGRVPNRVPKTRKSGTPRRT